MWFQAEYANELCRKRIAAATRQRLLANCDRRPTLYRQAARSLGRALLHLGAWLLRSSHLDAPAPHTSRSIARSTGTSQNFRAE
jgi:hypothetical protein